ncbi:phage antirepressor N-terminal domain-containing protein [uncultured Campylobacter sp.]|uniref:phage antirepressor N-terminal domain-containing protein n=1 Tax=uncultured Campylobacter sp. TaxID=218934 RepID=UPI0025D6FBA0|nr:phage antirepressor N-terminal domain-containing protein [uncultured Campylobacter sp.]
MELTNFSFNADIIQVFDEQGQYVSVKNLCKNIGIDFKTQYEKILSDESFCPKSFKIETNGGVQVALCVPVEKINGWLFSINPNKVKPEIKAKLILYKNECFDVLYKHFNASKFEAYVSKIADLEASQILQTKRHADQINGYLGQLAKHNALIASLKNELAEFKTSNPRPESLRTLLEHARKERDFYKQKLQKTEKEKRDKELVTFRALQQTKEQLEHVYTAIGAVEAYVANDDRFFIERNEILGG